MPSYRFCTADVFTDTAFAGNPLAVITDAAAIDTAAMQTIATEFNLSETAFVTSASLDGKRFGLRIFTPGAELPFAGHPTIGTALLLVEEGMVTLSDGRAEIVLEEAAGDVSVAIRTEDGRRIARFAAPALPERTQLDVSAADAAAMLGLPAGAVLAPPAAYGVGSAFTCVPLASRAALAAARIDSARWQAALASTAAPDVYPFFRDGGTIHARMFAPAHGIPEDPATGSAAVALAAWLAAEGGIGDGEHAWIIHQGDDMGRPSRIRLFASIANGAPVRIEVEGRAVPVSQGVLRWPGP